MSLFNKYENNELNMMFDVINYLCIHNSINRTEFRKISDFYNIRNYDYIKNKLLQCGAIYSVENNKNEWLGSEWLAEIPVLISNDELSYLKDILKVPQADLFFNSSEKDKISNQLKDIYSYENYIEEIKPKSKCVYSNYEKNNLKVILQAIIEKKNIKYEFKTRQNNNFVKVECAPYKIEYSAYDKRIWVILYNYQEKRVIKAKLHNLRNINIVGEITVNQCEIEEALRNKYSNSELVIKIIDKKNAKDRFFSLFDNYDKADTEVIDNDVYLVRMRYFDFDENDIIKKLLFLGENVILMEPESIRKKVIEKIKSSIYNYCK